MSIPTKFAENMRQIITDPAEYDDFMASLNKERHHGLRINTLKITPEAFEAHFPGFEPVPWCEVGRYYDHQTSGSMGKNPLHSAGLYYIQEPSAMSAVSILDVKPGEKVLDLCASPGGKSTQIAARLAGEGLLVSNDANFGRIPQLIRNIEMAGIANSIILCETPERIASRLPYYFDKVLVDAPCSGEGMFRKDPASCLAWDEGKPVRMAAIQKNILYHAARMVASGGYLAYSTCTFNTTENEDVISDFLAENRDFEQVDQKRILPHRHKGEWHFVALLRKTTQKTHIADDLHQSRQQKLDKDFKSFIDAYRPTLPPGEIKTHNNNLLVLPQIYPDLTGLQVIREGLLLGTLKKHRFEPSYALAMTLTADGFSNVINLPNHHPNITKFLKGETFEINAPDGYNLFCVESHPIGFAKILKNRLKGHVK